jgi:uncharacterized membrane protein YqhA
MRPQELSGPGHHADRFSPLRALESSRYLPLIASFALVIASAGVFLWGAWMTIIALVHLFSQHHEGGEVSVKFIQVMDVFVVATGLLIFGLGLEQLFVKELDVPGWLKLKTLHDLKARLSSVIILVMCIAFMDHLVEWKDPWEMLLNGVAVALVAAALIAFSQFGEKAESH